MGTTTGIAAKATQRIDTATLAASYDRHGAAVYGLARWITGDGEVAARLTADVFAALQWISVADGVEGLRGCVLTDVHRRAVAWTRTHSRLPRAPGAMPFDGCGDLSEDERVVVTEAYFGGKTYDAVAEILHTDRETVAALMQQALRRLAAPAATSPVMPRPQTA